MKDTLYMKLKEFNLACRRFCYVAFRDTPFRDFLIAMLLAQAIGFALLILGING